MMKKNYVAPETAILQFLDRDVLCNGGLTGWSANNESDDSLDSTGDLDSDKDPEYGAAGSKKFNAWSTWDE